MKTAWVLRQMFELIVLKADPLGYERIIYFDALLIASGHFWKPGYPQQRGLLFHIVSKIIISRREA